MRTETILPAAGSEEKAHGNAEVFSLSFFECCFDVFLLMENVHVCGVADDALRTDQFEVSECTLSGPSVGNITEDGVVASCHPPLPWNRNRNRVRGRSINTRPDDTLKGERSGVEHGVGSEHTCDITTNYKSR